MKSGWFNFFFNLKLIWIAEELLLGTRVLLKFPVGVSY